jgi:hypothetical protein
MRRSRAAIGAAAITVTAILGFSPAASASVTSPQAVAASVPCNPVICPQPPTSPFHPLPPGSGIGQRVEQQISAFEQSHPALARLVNAAVRALENLLF